MLNKNNLLVVSGSVSVAGGLNSSNVLKSEIQNNELNNNVVQSNESPSLNAVKNDANEFQKNQSIEVQAIINNNNEFQNGSESPEINTSSSTSISPSSLTTSVSSSFVSVDSNLSLNSNLVSDGVVIADESASLDSSSSSDIPVVGTESESVSEADRSLVSEGSGGSVIEDGEASSSSSSVSVCLEGSSGLDESSGLELSSVLDESVGIEEDEYLDSEFECLDEIVDLEGYESVSVGLEADSDSDESVVLEGDVDEESVGEEEEEESVEEESVDEESVEESSVGLGESEVDEVESVGLDEVDEDEDESVGLDDTVGESESSECLDESNSLIETSEAESGVLSDTLVVNGSVQSTDESSSLSSSVSSVGCVNSGAEVLSSSLGVESRSLDLFNGLFDCSSSFRLSLTSGGTWSGDLIGCFAILGFSRGPRQLDLFLYIPIKNKSNKVLLYSFMDRGNVRSLYIDFMIMCLKFDGGPFNLDCEDRILYPNRCLDPLTRSRLSLIFNYEFYPYLRRDLSGLSELRSQLDRVDIWGGEVSSKLESGLGSYIKSKGIGSLQLVNGRSGVGLGGSVGKFSNTFSNTFKRCYSSSSQDQCKNTKIYTVAGSLINCGELNGQSSCVDVAITSEVLFSNKGLVVEYVSGEILGSVNNDLVLGGNIPIPEGVSLGLSIRVKSDISKSLVVESIIDLFIVLRTGHNKGYQNNLDLDQFPVINDVLSVFIDKALYRDNLGEIAPYSHVKLFKWVYNTMLLLLIDFSIRTLHELSRDSDTYADCKALIDRASEHLDASLKLSLSRKGLSIHRDIMCGFDTEFESSSISNHNYLISAQLSVCGRICLKVPLVSDYRLSTLNAQSGESFADYLSMVVKVPNGSGSDGYDLVDIVKLDRLEFELNKFIKSIRNLNLNGYDSFLSGLHDYLSKDEGSGCDGGSELKNKNCTLESIVKSGGFVYYYFVRSNIKSYIYDNYNNMLQEKSILESGVQLKSSVKGKGQFSVKDRVLNSKLASLPSFGFKDIVTACRNKIDPILDYQSKILLSKIQSSLDRLGLDSVVNDGGPLSESVDFSSFLDSSDLEDQVSECEIVGSGEVSESSSEDSSSSSSSSSVVCTDSVNCQDIITPSKSSQSRDSVFSLKSSDISSELPKLKIAESAPSEEDLVLSGNRTFLRPSVDGSSEKLSKSRVSLSIVRNVYVLCYESRADIPMLGDWPIYKKYFRTVNKNFVTMGKRGFVELESGYMVHVKDVKLLAPAGGGLASLGKLFDLPKLKVPHEYLIQMSKYRSEFPNEFFEYGSRDSLITLLYGIQMEVALHSSGYPGFPLTISSMGIKLVKKHWSDIGYGGYEKHPDYPLGDVSKCVTPQGVSALGEFSSKLPMYIGAYKGGRNECYMYGYNSNLRIYDWDLCGAYSTVMGVLGHPVYDSGRDLTSDELTKLNSVSISDLGVDWLVFNYLVMDVSFEFPPDVKYPNIGVYSDRDSGLVHALKGRGVILGVEYYLAVKMGCKITVHSGYLIPFSDISKVKVKSESELSKLSPNGAKVGGDWISTLTPVKSKNGNVTSGLNVSLTPFTSVVKDLQVKRSKFPKGTFFNQYYKIILNTLYGCVSQAIGLKNRTDLATGEKSRSKPSLITNPILASYITAFVRSVLGECLFNIGRAESLGGLGGVVISATTDGFLTNLDNLEDRLLSLGDCSVLFRSFCRIRHLLAEDPFDGKSKVSSGYMVRTGLELKGSGVGVVSWKTRGQLSADAKIVAMTGYQRQGVPLDLLESHLIKCIDEKNFNMDTLHSSLRSGDVIWTDGGHCTMGYRDQNYSVGFDNRRCIIDDCVVDPSAKFWYDSRPHESAEVAMCVRKLSGLSRATPFSSLTRTESLNRYKNDLEIAYRTFLKGLFSVPPMFNLVRDFSGRSEVLDWLNTYVPESPLLKIKYSKVRLAKLIGRALAPKLVPRTRSTLSFVDFILTRYPHFDKDSFFAGVDRVEKSGKNENIEKKVDSD